MAVAEEAEVTDAVKPVRQHMDQEAADGAVSLEGDGLLTRVIAIVLPSENAVCACGRPWKSGDCWRWRRVGIAADIIENLFRASKRPPSKDHPIGVPGRRQVTAECGRLMQVAVRREEVQLAGGECLIQVAQEQSSEHPRQHPDRQEES